MTGPARPRRTRHDHSAGALGPVIIRRRHELGLTQQDLALLAGVGQRSIQALESGKITGRIDLVTHILSALGLALAVLPKSQARRLAEAEDAIVLGDQRSHNTSADPA